MAAFLSRFPLWPGHLLAAPTAHREQAIGEVEVEVEEYLTVQRAVHAAGRALTELIDTERLYVCSLGSQQGQPARALAPDSAAARCFV